MQQLSWPGLQQTVAQANPSTPCCCVSVYVSDIRYCHLPRSRNSLSVRAAGAHDLRKHLRPANHFCHASSDSLKRASSGLHIKLDIVNVYVDVPALQATLCLETEWQSND